MRRSKILAGIVITVAACLLAAAGLAGCSYYMKQQDIAQFRELIDSYAESDYNHAYHMENGFIYSEYPQEGSEQKVKEYNDWYQRFNKQGQDIPLGEWVKALEDERIWDKSLFIAIIDSANQEYWKEVDQFFPVLTSAVLSETDRQYLCGHLELSEEQKQQLEEIQWKRLEEAEVEDAMEFYTRIQEVYGYEDTEQLIECAEHFLSNPDRYSNEKLAGAALIKLQSVQGTEAYNEEEKEQLAAILRRECRNYTIEELLDTNAASMLSALLTLEDLEDVDWILEELDRLETDVSLLAWQQTNWVIDYLAKNEVYYSLCSSLSVRPDVLSRIVKIMNKMNTLRMADNLADPIEKVELYLKSYSNSYADLPDAAQTLSMLTVEQTPQGFTGWQAVCDVDGDGLGDQESFEAMNASGNAVYDVAFANGDSLHYEFPVRMPGIYERRRVDLNGDGIQEIIVYFHTDIYSMPERYGLDMDEYPESSAESYSALAAKEPAGMVVFSKKEGEAVYSPVLTKDGTTMVTDLFKEQNEYDSVRVLDEEKDWTAQLIWE